MTAQGVERFTNLIQTRNKATNETSKAFCVLDYVYDQNVTQLQKRNHFYDFSSGAVVNGRSSCQSTDDLLLTSGLSSEEDVNHKFVIISYSSDCSINDQINYYTNKSIYGLLISIGCSVDIDGGINITKQTLSDNKFSVSLISQTSVDQILRSNADQLKLFNIDFDASLSYGFDYSIVCIWVLATFTVTLGAFWSGTVRKNIFNISKEKTSEAIKRKLTKLKTINILTMRLNYSRNRYQRAKERTKDCRRRSVYKSITASGVRLRVSDGSDANSVVLLLPILGLRHNILIQFGLNRVTVRMF